MSKFFQKFEVRWNDVDANKHLGNVSYMAYATHARMQFLKQHKIGMKEFNRWGIGFVVMHETYSYFNEIVLDDTVFVSFDIPAFAQDGSIYKFVHQFYLADGTHCATVEALGVWIDTMLRKPTTPPDDITDILNEVKGEHTIYLSKDDLKKLPNRPSNILPSDLL